jgi:hypothetical protein
MTRPRNGTSGKFRESRKNRRYRLIATVTLR